MKHTLVIIGLLVLVYNNIAAQDYNALKSNCISYFKTNDNSIKCIRIDSVAKTVNDSIFYPYKNIQKLDHDCYIPKGKSWIGEKVVLNRGFNLFFNNQNDTIRIKTNATLNESWTAFEIKDSIIIKATILKHDTMSVLGMLDSVKTIGFKVYNKNMVLVDNELNNLTIKLSKNFGSVKTFNFLLFPYFNSQFSYLEDFNECELIGLTNPKLGLQNLTWMEVHDFNIGDEVHIHYKSSELLYTYSYFTEIKTKLKYVERFNYSDSIIYKINREQSIFKRLQKWDSTTYEYKHDTIISIIKRDSLFDILPGEPITNGHDFFTNTMTIGNFITKSQTPVYDRIVPSGFDSCWHGIIADGCFTTDIYYKGLGGPYYQCSGFWEEFSNNLVYFKKENVTWGNALIISGMDKLEKEGNTVLFPNPVAENLFIRTSDFPLIFELTDLRGVTVVKSLITSNESTISLKDLNKGLYLYKLIARNRLLKTDKLIKI